MIGSLTVLPALLAKLGRWVDRPPRPGAVAADRPRAGDGQRFWPARAAPGAALPAGHAARLGPGPARARRAGAGHEAEVPRHRGPAAHHAGDAGVRPADRGVPEHRHQPHWSPSRRRPGRPTPSQAALDGPGRAHAGRPAVRAAGRGSRRSRSRADGTVAVLDVATPYAGGSEEAERVAGQAARRPGAGDARAACRARSTRSAGSSAASVDYAAHIRQKLPLVDRLRAGADVPRDGVDVPLGGRRADLDRAEPAVRRRRVRPARAGLPGHLGRGHPGLHVDGRGRVAGCRCSSSWCCSACRWTTTCSSSAGSARRCCAGMPTRQAVAHGITSSAGVVTSAAIVMVGGVLDLRHAEHDRHEAARRRPGGGDPDRRDDLSGPWSNPSPETATTTRNRSRTSSSPSAGRSTSSRRSSGTAPCRTGSPSSSPSVPWSSSSIYLRQRGSPESKPVGSAHDDTGTTG